MHFKPFLSAGLCLALGLGMASGALAQTQPMVQQTQPMAQPAPATGVRGTVNVDVIDTESATLIDRVKSDVANRPAPQVGQTRAAIEAIYGPSQTDLAPNKNYDLYTNEFDLTDGRMFERQLHPNTLRIYEVTYNTPPTASVTKSATQTATDVKIRVIPRIGDHKNLVTKMLGEPLNRPSHERGQHVVYEIPKNRFVFYNDVLSSPFTALNMYFNTDGYLVGQETMPSRMRGQHVITSAGRYIPFESRYQPDTKIGY
jgi:hypothetical protein